MTVGMPKLVKMFRTLSIAPPLFFRPNYQRLPGIGFDDYQRVHVDSVSIGRLRSTIHQRFSDDTADLSKSPRRDGYGDFRDPSNEVFAPHVRGRFLRIQESRNREDDGGKEESA